MATKKISELEAISEAASDDVLAIVDVSETETRKITKGNLLVGAGHTIEMSLNSTTYTLTLSLKNEAGTVLNTQTIDLPNENALTNITYSNGILTLTKQNGATSTVDISGLISGLLSETTFNAFVTEIEEIIGISTDTYRTTSTYNTGDIVIYNGKIYKCNNNNVTGTFDDTKWDEISLYEYQKLQDQKIENKVEKENGKGLSTNDYTTAEKNKLSGVETGAQVNIIESVKVNGTALTPTDKEVDVPVPTKTSDLTNDSGFGTYTKPSGGIPKTDLSSDVQTSLGKADKAVQEEHKTGSQVEYKVLSDNNYTDEEKEKLASLENYDDTDITERVDDIEEEQETQNEDIEKLQDKVANQQKIISQMPKVTGEGTEFTLNNTIEAEFAEYAVEGRSVQETTTGVQLLDIASKAVKTHNGVTFTPQEDGGVKIVGTATAEAIFLLRKGIFSDLTDYTYKCWNLPTNCKTNIYYFGDVFGENIRTFAPNIADRNYNMNMIIPEGVTVNATVYPMLVKGSYTADTMPPYEKYTGGTASPNVDYPSERYSAGGNGSITQKITNSDNTKTQTYTMPVQQEMRDIKDSNGNVIAKDEFIEKDGVKYERHNVARVVFDGTETFVSQLSNEKIKQFRTPQNFLPNLLITPDPFAQLGNSASNYFIKLSNANALTDKGFTLNGNKQVIFNTEFTTVAELKAWLAEQYANGTPVYVDYILATPTDLPCTQAQIDVLENLPSTYSEQTNVFSEDTVSANVKASGYLDLNTLVARVARLETEV